MSNALIANGASETKPTFTNNPMNRRQLLRTFTLLGSLSIGGAALTGCGGGGNTNEKITLLLGAAPVNAKALTGKPATPDDVSEREILQAWLDKNKNVTIKLTEIDTGDDQKKQATLAARTAPAILGIFGNESLNRNAGNLKFAADVTELYQKYDVDNLLADYAKPYWDLSKNKDGKYYVVPGDAVAAGAGLFYRRDLLKEKGIEEPKIGWTWEQMFSLLRQFQKDGQPVMGAPSWMIGWYLNASMLDRHPDGVLGSIPAPKNAWHWQIDLDPWLDSWKKITESYRKVVLQEKLIEQNKTAYPWEGPAMGKFAAEQFPFTPGYGFQATIPGYAPVTISEMPGKLNKPFDEIVGFVLYPQGDNGAYNKGVYASLSGKHMFPRYLKAAELEKVFDLYLYRIYGDGYVNKYAKMYELTNEAKDAYKFIAPANKHQKNPKVPADVTIETAYGPKWVENYMDSVEKLKPLPDMASFFLPDAQTGPTSAAHDDLLDKLSLSNEDITNVCKTFQQTYNQQASTLRSDLSAEEFTTGAKAYLSALDTFFKTNLPEFHKGDWTKYYKDHALPALS